MGQQTSASDSSGIVDLFRSQLVEDPILYLVDSASIQRWIRSSLLPVWQVVALHSRVDPLSLVCDEWDNFAWVRRFQAIREGPDPESGRTRDRRLADNLAAVLHAISHYRLLTHTTNPDLGAKALVNVAEFHAWAVRTGLPVIDGWPTREEAYGSTAVDSGVHVSRWPWGSHETWRLRVFAEIAEHWRLASEGGPFDPSDMSTAPKKEVIVPMISTMLRSEKVASAMFTMLSPDDLPKGPRGRRKAT